MGSLNQGSNNSSGSFRHPYNHCSLNVPPFYITMRFLLFELCNRTISRKIFWPEISSIYSKEPCSEVIENKHQNIPRLLKINSYFDCLGQKVIWCWKQFSLLYHTELSNSLKISLGTCSTAIIILLCLQENELSWFFGNAKSNGNWHFKGG